MQKEIDVSMQRKSMRSRLEHYEVMPGQAKLFPSEFDSEVYDNLKQCCEVGRALFSDDPPHKIVRTLMGAYRGLVQRGEERYLLGVSTRRAVYVRLVK